MTDTQQIRQDLLLFIRDHPGTDKWDVLEEVCPVCQRTGFHALKGLIDEGLVKVDFIHTETKVPDTRNVRFALTLTSEGRTAAEAVA